LKGVDEVQGFVDGLGSEPDVTVRSKTPLVDKCKFKKRKQVFKVFLVSLSVSFLVGTLVVFPFFDDRRGVFIPRSGVDIAEKDIVQGVGDDPPVEPEAYIYEHFIPPDNSFGLGETTFKTVNWSYFWQLFRNHSLWQLEAWHPVQEVWVDNWEGTNLNQWLNITRVRSPDNSSEKVTLNVTNMHPSQDLFFRFTFGIDLRVKQYVNKSSWYEYELVFPANETEDYTVFFNFSDVKPLIQDGVVIPKHGVKNVGGKDVFWFRLTQNMSRNPLPSGNCFEIDPDFGNAAVPSTSSYIYSDTSSGRMYMRGIKSSPGSSGTADNITVKAWLWFNAADAQCALYEYVDDTDLAGDLVAKTETKEIPYTINGYVEFSFSNPKPTLVSGTNYYICIQAAEDLDVDNSIGTTTGGGHIEKVVYENYEDMFNDPMTGETSESNTIVIYCSYTESGGGSNSNPDEASGEVPTNSSTSISLNPTLFGVVTDPDGDTMNVSWYSNSSGSWVLFATNTSVANNTNITQATVNFSSYSTKYWWSMNISDGEEGYKNSTFSFTTLSASWNEIADWNTTVSNNTFLWNSIQDWNTTISNTTFSWNEVNNWNTTVSNGTFLWNELADWNTTISNTSFAWNEIVDWNSTVSNQSVVWNSIGEFNVTVSNSTFSWNEIANWNTTVSNGTFLWGEVNNWNSTVSNSSFSWNSVNDYNLTVSNLSIWNSIQDFNLTISNTSVWNEIQDWNVTISNNTFSWNSIADWNLTVSNSSVWNEIQNWNATVSNVTFSWIEINDYNVTVSNSSFSFKEISNWNSTVSNSSFSWNSIADWNSTVSNQSVVWNSIGEFNLTVSNLSSWVSVADWNVTVSNSSSSWNVINDYNVTVSNSTFLWNQINDYNVTVSNQSVVWNQVQDWNATVSNTTFSWVEIVDYNFTVSNSSSWVVIENWNTTVVNNSFSFKEISNWNSTIVNNSFIWVQVQNWNLTVSNSSFSWNSIADWNSTVSNQSSGWNSIADWNSTVSNSSVWNSIKNWNLTVSNSSTPDSDFIVVSGNYPGNASNNIPLQVNLYATFNHTNGETMNVSWYWGTTEGDENTLIGSDSGFVNSTQSELFFASTGRRTVYYWRVMVDDGSYYENNTFNFTTASVGGGGVSVRDSTALGIACGALMLGSLGLFGFVRRRRKH